MVCRDDWTDDGLPAQTVLFPFPIRPATKPSPRFAQLSAFPQRRALWLPIRRLCAGIHNASTILRAKECSQCATGIVPGLARPTAKGDWNQLVFGENRARRLSSLVRLRLLNHTPS